MTRAEFRGWTRRSVLAAMGVAAANRGSIARAAGSCTDGGVASGRKVAIAGLPLGHVNKRVRWGSAIESPALYDTRLREALRAEAPRVIAIGSGLKFPTLYPTPPDLALAEDPPERWREARDVAAFANALGVPVRGDCLAWNDWLPGWVKDIAARRDVGWKRELDAYFTHHFVSVFAQTTRLKAAGGLDEFRWCGVVNEPFDPWRFRSGAGGWRPGPWLDAYGVGGDGVPRYIHRAFELAEMHRKPATALFLNEAHCDNDHFGPQMRPALLRLVDALQKAGRQVDAVGLECHLMPQWMGDRETPNWRPFQAFVRELAQRNVAIFVTELDVNDCSLRDEGARDRLVALYMGSFVTAALETGLVEMVTAWDFSDKYSWLRGDAYPSLGEWAGCVAHPPCPRPDLYDQSMEAKPARHALARALARGA